VVFALALPLQDDVRLPVPAWSIAAFAALLLVLMHPRVAPRVFDRLLRRIDGTTVPRLPMRTLALTFGWYLLTWLVSGVALMLMVRSVADIPAVERAVPGRGERDRRDRGRCSWSSPRPGSVSARARRTCCS
jgi:hypothetical protein